MNETVKKIKVDHKVELAYQWVGKLDQNKPLLLFLHEGLGSIAQFKNFPTKLCETLGLTGMVYERYGYGNSTPLQENRTFDYLEVEGNYYLPKLIENLGLENQELILIGHSDGASIALIYASLFPQKVKMIVSMAAHVFNEPISVDSINKLAFLYENNPKLKKSFEKYHFEHTDSTFYAFANTITHPSFKNWNIEHYLPQITAPIIAIQGFDDEYGTAKQVESIVTNAQNKYNRNIMIPKCGHSPHLQKQSFVIKQIGDFYHSINQLDLSLTIGINSMYEQ